MIIRPDKCLDVGKLRKRVAWIEDEIRPVRTHPRFLEERRAINGEHPGLAIAERGTDIREIGEVGPWVRRIRADVDRRVPKAETMDVPHAIPGIRVAGPKNLDQVMILVRTSLVAPHREPSACDFQGEIMGKVIDTSCRIIWGTTEVDHPALLL